MFDHGVRGEILAAGQRAGARPRSSAGLSLVETLVVIAILAILLGLALPVLSRARVAGGYVVELSNLRTHGNALQMYAADFEDRLVVFSSSPEAIVGVRDPSTGESFQAPLFVAVARFWGIPMREYYQDRYPHPSQRDRRTREMVYELTASAYATPAFWRDTTREGPTQWRYMSTTDVLHPSQKASFMSVRDGYPALSDRRHGVQRTALFDGSATTIGSSSMSAPYRSGEGHWPGTYHHIGAMGLHTIDGLAGRDLPSSASRSP